jgi:hypothetical protein
MKRHARKAFNQLKKLGCPVKEWHDDSRGHFWIDGEEPGADEWLDYWSMDLMMGSDLLNTVLGEHGLYWSWENSVSGHIYDI